MNFRGLSPREKRTACVDASFPCKKSCAQDYGAACPTGWEQHGETCLAPPGYQGPCVGKKSFRNLGLADRRAWADICDVEWPCRKSLEEQMKLDLLEGVSWRTA